MCSVAEIGAGSPQFECQVLCFEQVASLQQNLPIHAAANSEQKSSSPVHSRPANGTLMKLEPLAVLI